LTLFALMQGLAMFAFAFTSSNLGTLAMERMGPIAGTASSVQGVIGTVGGALIGLFIGQHFNGTQLPFLIGFALCAAAALLLIVLTEPTRLLERLASSGGSEAKPSPSPAE
jgi:DHA1 family bicyclomycin/chloramphenicol resistance-like MFS transporter